MKQSVVYDLRDQKKANSFKDFWRQWTKASRHPKFNEQERELEVRALIWAFRAKRQYLDMISQKEIRWNTSMNFTMISCYRNRS